MQKTVREWLEELPEPYRSQALEVATGRLDKLVSSQHVAILEFAKWHETPQGEHYWNALLLTLLADSENQAPIPAPTERQTAEALLKEFGDWFNSDKRLLIHNDAIQDFLTSKYGKG